MRFLPPVAALPANYSRFSLAGSAASVDAIAVAANTGGAILWTACVYTNELAAAADTGFLQIGAGGAAFEPVGRIKGPNRLTQLQFPILIPPGVGVTFFGTDADVTASGAFQLL